MAWRLIAEDGVGAAAGLACDELLAQRAARAPEPTLRLYTYRAHAALVGRFQDAAREVHLGYCAANGIEVNRRPTGGGAILMGPDQLGVALALRGRGEGRPRVLMARFSDGLARGLRALGIEAAFRGKNDLHVGGRKIAGLGLYRDPGGGMLFHASLLVDLDVALMARVLRTPFAEVTPAEIAAVSARTVTVRALLGSAIALEEVRGRVAAGFAESFGAALERGELDAGERLGVEELVRAKYGTEGWVRQQTAVPDANGAASLPAPAGRVDVRVALAGGMIKALQIRGAFFETEAAVADLEGRLAWHAAEPEAVAKTVAAWARATPGHGLDPAAVARAIEAAVRAARAEPYGCFVTPEARRG